MTTEQIIGLVVGGGALALMLLVIFLKAHILRGHPNELLVIAGRQRKLKDGSLVGYRVIRGGRGFKWPLVETAARLPLTTLPAELVLQKVMCSGMIPVNVVAKATVKLAGREEDGVDQAIERFLGKGPDDVVKTAKQALEGALRGVIATVPPEEANSNRLELASQAAEKARADLRRLGVVLDFLQIQEITDEQGYLEAIGRRQNAQVQRDARVAEATTEAEARTVAAEQRRIGREAEISADLEVVKKENVFEVKRADLKAKANQAEQRAAVAGDIARTEEKVLLEAQRVALSQKRQEAETVIPARARQQALALEAEGKAARILEDGKATAQAIELMRAQWDDEATRDLFLIQLLPGLLDKVTRVVSENLRIDKLTVLDGGKGDGLPSYVKNLTSSAVVMLEELKNASGIDFAKLIQKGREEQGGRLPKELD